MMRQASTVRDLVEDALVGYRVTRLVTEDTILDGPRSWLIEWAHRNDVTARKRMMAAGFDPAVLEDWGRWAMVERNLPKLATLVTCRWCAGVWVTVGILIARRLFPRPWRTVRDASVIASGAALIAGLEKD